MKIRFILLSFFIGAILLSCKDDEAGKEPVLPSELSLKVQKDAENPEHITLRLSSENTNFYKVFFGESAGEIPVVTNEEALEYTYSQSGTYTTKVQAHATEVDYIAETQEVAIQLGDEVENIPEIGYTTPESYEGMALVWQDEFEGNSLNPDDWNFEIGTGDNGWGNDELQYYRKENTKVEDGYLMITAKKEPFEGSDYTSSRITTQDKQSFKYGRIDIRAALPQGQGIWPALWMLGSNFSTVGWPASGELDIMEMVGGGAGRDDVVHGTVHWSHNGNYASHTGDYTLTDGIFADEFHVLSIMWDENAITWYVDDVAFNEIDITTEELSEFHEEFFFIFNVAVGGRWPGSPDAGTVFPQQMVVDYVRVFQEQ